MLNYDTLKFMLSSSVQRGLSSHLRELVQGKWKDCVYIGLSAMNIIVCILSLFLSGNTWWLGLVVITSALLLFGMRTTIKRHNKLTRLKANPAQYAIDTRFYHAHRVQDIAPTKLQRPAFYEWDTGLFRQLKIALDRLFELRRWSAIINTDKALVNSLSDTYLEAYDQSKALLMQLARQAHMLELARHCHDTQQGGQQEVEHLIERWLSGLNRTKQLLHELIGRANASFEEYEPIVSQAERSQTDEQRAESKRRQAVEAQATLMFLQ